MIGSLGTFVCLLACSRVLLAGGSLQRDVLGEGIAAPLYTASSVAVLALVAAGYAAQLLGAACGWPSLFFAAGAQASSLPLMERLFFPLAMPLLCNLSALRLASASSWSLAAGPLADLNRGLSVAAFGVLSGLFVGFFRGVLVWGLPAWATGAVATLVLLTTLIGGAAQDSD